MERLGEVLKNSLKLTPTQKSSGAEHREKKRREWEIEADREFALKEGFLPDCPRCGGRGWMGYDVPVGHENFGRADPCDYPGCHKDQWEAKRRSPGAMKNKGIDKPGQTFETFKPLKGTKEAFEKAKALAKGDANFISLLIFGDVGNGKSHLASATAMVLNQRGITCRFYVVADMFAYIRDGISVNEFDERKQAIKDSMALVLDDYKPEFATLAQQD